MKEIKAEETKKKVIKHKENKKINIMRSIPVTTRLKRVPAKKAIAKLTEDEIKQMTPKASIVNEGEDKETIENKLGYSGKNQKLTQEQSDWKNKQIKELGSVQAYRDKYKIGKQVVVGKVDVDGKKGKKKNWEDNIKVKTTGDILDSYDTRVQSRAIKKEQRDIRRSKIKNARSSGTLTKALRKQFKNEETKAEMEEFEAASNRGKAARASGRKPGSKSVDTGERNMRQSEIGDLKEQSLYLKNKAARKEGIIIDDSPAKQAVGKLRTSFKMKGYGKK